MRRLFDFYDACEREGIGLYGGGQFELGPGRDQIQLLASLFHAGRAERCRAGRVQRERAGGGPADAAALTQLAAGLPSLSAFSASRPTDSSPASPSGYHCAPSHGSPLPTSR